MPSIAEQILDRMKTVATGSTPAGTRVWRAREDALGQDEMPGMIQHRGPETVERLASAIDRCSLEVRFAIYAAGAAWETPADDVAVSLHAALNGDTTLRSLLGGGNKGQGLERVSAEPDADKGDATAGRLTVTYRCIYLTRVTAIDAKP